MSATSSCPICKEHVHDKPTDAKPHPDAIVEHHDCFYPSRGARWALPEPPEEVEAAPGEPPAFVTEAFDRLVAAGRGAIDIFNQIPGPLLPEVTPTAIAMPKNVRDSICRVLTTSPRDWSMTHEDAWIYGVVCGWPEDAVEEVAARHRWSPITVDRLRVLHEEWESGRTAPADVPLDLAALADHVIAAIANAGAKLVPPWGRRTDGHGTRWAERGVRGYSFSILFEDPGDAPIEAQMAAADVHLRADGLQLTEDIVRAAIASWARTHAAAPVEPVSMDHGRAATDEDVERTWKTFWAGTMAPNGVVDLEAVKRELFDYACLLDAVPKVYMHVTGGKVSKPTTLPDVVIAMADDRTTELAEERVAEVVAERDRGVDTEAAIEREVGAARARAAEREERRPSIDGRTEVAMVNVFATPGGKPPPGWPEPGETS